MIRSHAQNRAMHALLGDFARSWSHEGVRLTAAEWKAIHCTLFACFLAECEGQAIPIPHGPESTSQMDSSRMNNMLEYLQWIGAEIGVIFSE